MLVDGCFADEYAAGMDGALMRKVVQVLRKKTQRLVQLCLLGFGRRFFLLQLLNFGGRKSNGFAQFPKNGPVLKRNVRAQKGHVLSSVSVEQILKHFVPVLPRKIEIEVGRTRPVRVDESLKIQIQFDRIHVGNVQAVGGEGVGARSAANVKKSSSSGVLNQIPIDEEVRRKSQLVNGFQLFFQSGQGFRGSLSIPLF